MMRVPVLVPYNSRNCFQEEMASGLEPIFYSPKGESLLQRLGRKVGLRDLRATMWSRLGLAGEKVLLDKTYAMWLSPSLYLPAQYMRCLVSLLPKLTWVYSQMAGIDHLDLDIFKERGVMVSNNGNLSSRRVGETALACMLSHAKRLPMHFSLQQRRAWSSLPSDDLCNKTVGIIGTGNIGREVASMCRGIGMCIIGASRNPHRFGAETAPFHRVVRLDNELDALLAQADYVVLTVPLNEKTRGLVGRTELRKMKRTSCLVNIARGEVVVESELCKALTDKVIDAAYIDRPNRVPLRMWSRLYSTPNLFLTHYSAANSTHAIEDGFKQFVEGVRVTLETGKPPDRVA